MVELKHCVGFRVTDGKVRGCLGTRGHGPGGNYCEACANEATAHHCRLESLEQIAEFCRCIGEAGEAAGKIARLNITNRETSDAMLEVQAVLCEALGQIRRAKTCIEREARS